MDGSKGYYLIAGSDDTIIAALPFIKKVGRRDIDTKSDALDQGILGPLLASPTEAIDGTVLVNA
jgi:hypothetical protein